MDFLETLLAFIAFFLVTCYEEWVKNWFQMFYYLKIDLKIDLRISQKKN